MSRMTKRTRDGHAIMNCMVCSENWGHKPHGECTALYCRNRLKDRLAEFEDIGLEPAEIVGMIPPCRVGDEVFGFRMVRGTLRVKSGPVTEIYYGDDMRLGIAVKNVCRGVWGRSVFGTREEDEAALAGPYERRRV